MRKILFYNLLFLLIACDKKVTPLNDVDKFLLNESLTYFKTIYEKDFITINGFIENNKKSLDIHLLGVQQIDSFDIELKTYLISHIMANQGKLKKLSLEDVSVPNITIANEDLKEDIQLYNFSDITYGKYKGVDFASLTIYWIDDTKKMNGYYFHYLKDDDANYYYPLVFGETIVP